MGPRLYETVYCPACSWLSPHRRQPHLHSVEMIIHVLGGGSSRATSPPEKTNGGWPVSNVNAYSPGSQEVTPGLWGSRCPVMHTCSFRAEFHLLIYVFPLPGSWSPSAEVLRGITSLLMHNKHGVCVGGGASFIASLTCKEPRLLAELQNPLGWVFKAAPGLAPRRALHRGGARSPPKAPSGEQL